MGGKGCVGAEIIRIGGVFLGWLLGSWEVFAFFGGGLYGGGEFLPWALGFAEGAAARAGFCASDPRRVRLRCGRGGGL